MKFTITDYGFIQQDTMFYTGDEENGFFGFDPLAAIEWSEWLADAISNMKKFGVTYMWDFFHPVMCGLEGLANRIGVDSSIAAIGYHVEVVSSNTSFVKILIYKDGNPRPLQIVFYNEYKQIGIISPIASPQYCNKQTHRRKRTKKLSSHLRKFSHTELPEASLFIEKAINTFVMRDPQQ